MEDKIVIVGAGLVGITWSLYLSKLGVSVDVYEKREDLRRRLSTESGRSINIALSNRGWNALDELEIKDIIKSFTVPMYGRVIHQNNGERIFQPYSEKKKAIFSISRNEFTKKLLNIAEQHPNINFHFSHYCKNIDLKTSTLEIEDLNANKTHNISCKAIFASDGANSSIRQRHLIKFDRFNYSQNFLKDGYLELNLPAKVNKENPFFDNNALHIWPRKDFMLIALPNSDESFTFTLFMPFVGKESFENLDSKEKVKLFFKKHFKSIFDLYPQIIDNWDSTKISSLTTIECFPWSFYNTLLLGDAAHATVPFFGQGLNAGLENCNALYKIAKKNNCDWKKTFLEFQELRKPQGDALHKLSLNNYKVMSTEVANPKYLMLKEMERTLAKEYPKIVTPLYELVSFSSISYSDALKRGNMVEKCIKTVMSRNNFNLKNVDTSLVKKEIINLIEHELNKKNT